MVRKQRVGATSRREFERQMEASRKEFERLEALCREEFEDALGKRQREAKNVNVAQPLTEDIAQ